MYVVSPGEKTLIVSSEMRTWTFLPMRASGTRYAALSTRIRPQLSTTRTSSRQTAILGLRGSNLCFSRMNSCLGVTLRFQRLTRGASKAIANAIDVIFYPKYSLENTHAVI